MSVLIVSNPYPSVAPFSTCRAELSLQPHRSGGRRPSHGSNETHAVPLSDAVRHVIHDMICTLTNMIKPRSSQPWLLSSQTQADNAREGRRMGLTSGVREASVARGGALPEESGRGRKRRTSAAGNPGTQHRLSGRSCGVFRVVAEMSDASPDSTHS